MCLDIKKHKIVKILQDSKKFHKKNLLKNTYNRARIFIDIF